jgi:hypothetical protein
VWPIPDSAAALIRPSRSEKPFKVSFRVSDEVAIRLIAVLSETSQEHNIELLVTELHRTDTIMLNNGLLYIRNVVVVPE